MLSHPVIDNCLILRQFSILIFFSSKKFSRCAYFVSFAHYVCLTHAHISPPRDSTSTCTWLIVNINNLIAFSSFAYSVCCCCFITCLNGWFTFSTFLLYKFFSSSSRQQPWEFFIYLSLILLLCEHGELKKSGRKRIREEIKWTYAKRVFGADFFLLWTYKLHLFEIHIYLTKRSKVFEKWRKNGIILNE